MKARIDLYFSGRCLFGREVAESSDTFPEGLPSFFLQEIANVFEKHDIEIVGFNVKKLR